MTILDDIAKYKREEIAQAKARMPQLGVEEMASAVDAPREFRNALLKAQKERRYGLIAEIKKASPSKGLIRDDFDPPLLARQYEEGGATCLSILTDMPSFKGALDYLRTARKASRLPCLRKDFMFEPYQVVEARAWGADCILVIMAAVTDDEARALIDEAKRWKMDVLVEVHNKTELDRALALGANMIGINNRDLRTFQTRLEHTLNLIADLPSDVCLVSESGIRTRGDIERLQAAGVRAVLIGETFMRSPDMGAKLRELRGINVERN
jgi:indole-3-glycerol phosphate synthase